MKKLEAQNKIGQKLKDLRLKKEKSHENFAFDAEFSRSYYWKIEKGNANLTLNKLFEILEIHKITLSEFFDDFNEIILCERKTKRNKLEE